jgi:hypothetical protein
VRLIKASNDKLLFHLGKREKHLLVEVLKLYPRIPSGHQSLSKSHKTRDREANQRLLDEALAEQRAECKKHLRAFLEDSRRFEEDQTGCRLSLCNSEPEWLLQVLNDIRVGSWLSLGSPEPPIEIKTLNERTAPDFWAMEMAGHFQMQLLAAMEGR